MRTPLAALLLLSALLALNDARADPKAEAAPPVDASAGEPGPDDPAVKLIENDRLDGQPAMNTAFALGLSPTANAGLGMSLGFRWRDVAFVGEGRALFPLGVSRLPGGHDVAMLVAVGLLSLCFEESRPFFFCAVAEGGRLIDGVNMRDDPSLVSHNLFFAASGLRLGAVYGFSNGNYLRAFVEPSIMLVRPKITTNETTDWQMPPFSVVLGFELACLASSSITHRNRWPETVGWGTHPHGWGKP